MKNFLRGMVIIACLCVIFMQLSCTVKFIPYIKTSTSVKIDTSESTTSEETSAPHLLNPGDIIIDGGYIEFADVQIQYCNGTFLITNNRNDTIDVYCWVIGTKTDGTYELLQSAGFVGFDEDAYESDLSENGWAVEHYTNRIKPGKTLSAILNISDFDIEGVPKPDINNDGFYELKFKICPQTNEIYSSVGTNDPESDMYKLPIAN